MIVTIIQANSRCFIIARNGHLTDDGQSVIIDEVIVDRNVTNAPAPAVVIPVFLAITMVIHLGLLACSLVEE